MNCREFVALEGLSKPAWRNARRSGLGGSDAPVLFGLHRFQSREGLIRDKLGMEPEDVGSEAKSRGHAREPVILSYVASLWDVDVETPAHMYQHADIDHVLCNLDSWLVSRSNRTKCKGRGIAEAKSTTVPEQVGYLQSSG